MRTVLATTGISERAAFSVASALNADSNAFGDYQTSFLCDNTVSSVILPAISSLPSNAGDFFVIAPSGVGSITVTASDPIVNSAVVNGTSANAAKEFIAIGLTGTTGYWLAR